jgi:SecD/SecF fusion protein
MNRNHLWRLIIILAILAWSLAEIYPPTARDLVQYFADTGVHRDATFTAIVEHARQDQKERPDPARAYDDLLRAINTNDIVRYFPMYEATNEAHPTTFILNHLQHDASGRIKLGIDLAGGTSFLVEMDTNKLMRVETRTNDVGRVETITNAPAASEISGALSQAIEVLRKRVDRFGVAEPVFQPEGANRIRIQLPGLSASVKSNTITTLQRPAFLEFRLMHPKGAEQLAIGAPGYEVLTMSKTLPNGAKAPAERFLVKKRPEMTGGVLHAGVSRSPMGQPEIVFELDSEAGATFGRVTKANVGQFLCIVLDGELQSVARINEEIPNGRVSISGDFSDQEAFNLANVLENPLKTPVHIMGQEDVDPTLGRDSIRSGMKASIYGVLAVAAFMVLYYLLAGAVADVALILNIIILVGVMCSIGTTFTLPGIAGLVLTVGMAVDANVLIFERIREESAKGKSLKGALQAGYDRAFGTIFDSHVTTLISSLILVWMGTGSVKGFGVSLTIGVAASLFTALVVTRLIFDWLINKNVITSLRMNHLIRVTNLDFMKLAIPAFVASWILIIAGNSYGIFVRGHDVLGVEFAGGETVRFAFDQGQRIKEEQIRATAQSASGGDVLVAYQHNISTSTDTLLVTVRDFGDNKGSTVDPGEKVTSALSQAYPQAKFQKLSENRVGPTVGEEIRETAILSSLLAMFGILVYVAFRYEFSFAVGAVVAIIHDVLMTLGWYFLAGRELNATTVAAVLTIIGFSINDTIVIFDRIREDLRLGVRGTFREVMNQALNQTLSRTIITSGTVFLATLSLFIFGGGPINDFAFTFLVGILTGTYSSIYIASALVLWWHKGQRPKIGNAQVSVENAAAVRK